MPSARNALSPSTRLRRLAPPGFEPPNRVLPECENRSQSASKGKAPSRYTERHLNGRLSSLPKLACFGPSVRELRQRRPSATAETQCSRRKWQRQSEEGVNHSGVAYLLETILTDSFSFY